MILTKQRPAPKPTMAKQLLGLSQGKPKYHHRIIANLQLVNSSFLLPPGCVIAANRAC